VPTAIIKHVHAGESVPDIIKYIYSPSTSPEMCILEYMRENKRASQQRWSRDVFSETAIHVHLPMNIRWDDLS